MEAAMKEANSVLGVITERGRKTAIPIENYGMATSGILFTVLATSPPEGSKRCKKRATEAAILRALSKE